MKRNLLNVVFMGLLCIASAGCQLMGVTQPFAYTEDSVGITNIQLKNTTGSIQVFESDDDQIYIRGEKIAYNFANPNSVQIDISKSSDTLTIKSDYLYSALNSVSVDYELFIPRGMTLTVSNVTGSVEVDGRFYLAGIDITTGSISVANTLAVSNLSTTTGSIRAYVSELLSSPVEMSTVTGSITLRIDPALQPAINTQVVTGTISNTASTGKVGKLLEVRTVTGSIMISN